MKYKLELGYKSLKPFEIELPDFVILTGVNGVGKTQILQSLIQNNSPQAKISIDNQIIPPHKIKYFDKLISPNDLHAIDRHTFNDSEDYELHEQLFPAYNVMLNYSIEFGEYPQSYSIYEKFNNERYGNTLVHPDIFKKIKKFIEDHSNNTHPDFEFFKNNFRRNYRPQINDLFTQNFSQIFKKYQDLIFKNDFNQFLNERKGKSLFYLEEEEFKELHGNAPWETINNIIETATLDYIFEVPKDYDPNITYAPRFIKKSTRDQVQISELSSGEKILISLAFALYNKDYANQIPNVILLDETDASLHPSMTKQYLNILKNTFVKDLGIQVIITTHSPSTVALADESDIYVVENSEQRIRKCSKDEALSVLTAGVPSLSINYENRKQVFVESLYDVKYYDAIYKILNPYLNKEISLNFISSGDSRTDENGDPIANCSQVKNITQTMRKYGNKSCFGIIDWDLKNQDNQDGIFVNAFNQQYSVENCLLNPLFLGLLILALKTGSQNDISHRYVDLNHHSIECLQEIHDWILKKIEVQFPNKNQNQTSVYLTNGVKISTPEWFTHHQGHELESKILNQIPELRKIKQNKEEKLKLEIINKVFDDFPQLVPTYFKEVFIKIQAS